jgi:hypothetical protein
MLIAEECCVPLEKIIPSELCVVLDSLMGCESIFRYYFQPILVGTGLTLMFFLQTGVQATIRIEMLFAISH